MSTTPEDPATDDPSTDAPAVESPATEPAADPASDAAQKLPEDVAALSYEAARDQLVEVVRRLESGQGGLEESIALWERGEMLARRCQQWLDGARQKLDEAVQARR
ncbi:exodeoxyribonuclease VII small subunit [Brachybacterium sp. MASK1Z-5]|uniref:Exodeoxyribonuclease 7 small subunit n=1 Tax=Brachybacterium halotolerans TaxID=2795215 RepID=A0ABS1B933_9MICO|nr:exodeoxyribonuclease VII small subunit [Brachybacterium halotolerans]MBK0331158.1 exodeoxyribonuclease VII small subunit [Brachybacterium halotolerans]